MRLGILCPDAESEKAMSNQKKFSDEREAIDKRTKIKVFWQDAEDTGESDLFAGRTWRGHHDPETYYTYTSDEIDITVHKDGAISFFCDNAESHIYFYPDQVKYLIKAVEAARKASK